MVTLSVVFFSSLAGFAFAKLRFRGTQRAAAGHHRDDDGARPSSGIIPLYMLMVKLGWNGQLQAVIVPFLVTGFGVFMMRQYAAQALPDELIEAARVDGCSTFAHLLERGAARAAPAAAVLGLFTFMQTWNDFLWPLAVLNPDNPTVQVSLRSLATGYFQDYTQVFAGTALGDAAAARRVRRVRPPDHRRHHGRRGQGMTIAQDARPARPRASAQFPAGLCLGRGHRRLPDRGRGRRGRARPVHLGHLRRTPGRCSPATPATSPRPLPPVPPTTWP